MNNNQNIGTVCNVEMKEIEEIGLMKSISEKDSRQFTCLEK